MRAYEQCIIVLKIFIRNFLTIKIKLHYICPTQSLTSFYFYIMDIFITLGLMAFIGLLFIANFFVIVPEGKVVVITSFGKFKRIMGAGFHLKQPFFERVAKHISLQNLSEELAFQAITSDQANVGFKTLVLYAVHDNSHENLYKVAYKFDSETMFRQTLFRSIESTVRAFVATKRQVEILALRNEIINEVKTNLDQSIAEWGYKLLDLQINEIKFDQTIMTSMAEVVASQNLKEAAYNQGEATLVKRTKEAEAEGNTIRIAAEAEKVAAQLRGQGTALFREEVARGIRRAAVEIKAAGLDASFVSFSMWLESMRYIAKEGKGNFMTFDGSVTGEKALLKELMALNVFDDANKATARLKGQKS